jgi:hypothetical protein
MGKRDDGACFVTRLFYILLLFDVVLIYLGCVCVVKVSRRYDIYVLSKLSRVEGHHADV